MNFKVKQIAEFLKGEIVGNADVTVNNICKIEEGLPNAISFLANPKYEKYIYTTQASVVIVNKDFKPEAEVKATLIKVENAYNSFASLLKFYNQNKHNKVGKDKHSYVSKTAKIGKNTYIAAFVSIGNNSIIKDNAKIYANTTIGDNVVIAENTIIYSGVNIYSDCKIGANCIIHSGVVIGGDGFGFAPQNSDAYLKVPQVGNVVLEDFVEIGSNTNIDRATIGSTIIRKGVKLDNLIQIAHNVEIGENTVIAAQTGVSGSTKIGKNCMIGGQVGIVGHISIADEVKIGAKSGINRSITEKGAILQGEKAFKINDFNKSYVIFKKLPEIYKELNEMKKNNKQ